MQIIHYLLRFGDLKLSEGNNCSDWRYWLELTSCRLSEITLLCKTPTLLCGTTLFVGVFHSGDLFTVDIPWPGVTLAAGYGLIWTYWELIEGWGEHWGGPWIRPFTPPLIGLGCRSRFAANDLFFCWSATQFCLFRCLTRARKSQGQQHFKWTALFI